MRFGFWFAFQNPLQNRTKLSLLVNFTLVGVSLLITNV
jgi:hypothetical protein